MEAVPTSESDPMEEARAKLIRAALPHVVFDGWSDATLEMAIAETDVEAGIAHLAFPRGGVDMALAFHAMNDARLAEDLARDPVMASMRVREKIAHAVRRRLELVAPHREAVRRAGTLLALPPYAPEGARAIWQTADTIWTAAGDTSDDYNWYTKRAILASVYSATVLYWLGDETPGFSATWSFLDRRIDDVMRFEKAKAAVLSNPLAKAALWAPTRILETLGGAIRRPGTEAPPPEAGSSTGPTVPEAGR